MKKVFLAAVLAVGITAFAQETQPKKEDRPKLTTEQKVDFQVKKITKDLDLNAKQVSDVKAIMTKEVEKREAKIAEMKEKKELNAKNREEVKAEMEKEQAMVSTEMKKILTADQYAKWEKMREERKEMMKQRMMERRGKADSKEIPEDKSK